MFKQGVLQITDLTNDYCNIVSHRSVRPQNDATVREKPLSRACRSQNTEYLREQRLEVSK